MSDTEKAPKQKTLRCKFTPEEDAKLKKLVSEYGLKNWGEISKQMPNRTGRQCRDRYCNYLKSGLTSKEWTPEEDELVLKLVEVYGFHWVEISKKLKGRSGNNVKNRWHKFLSRYQNTSAEIPKYETRKTKIPKKSQKKTNPVEVKKDNTSSCEETANASEPVDILSIFDDQTNEIQLFPIDGETNDSIFSLFKF